jgi:tetratricopeptide (TPR) repeat protein
MVYARIIIVTMSNKKIAVPVIITALLAAVFLPIVFMGYVALNRGQTELSGGNYVHSAESFEQAARLLPWRDDLWEKAGITAAKGGEHLQALEYFGHASTLTEEGWMWLGIAHLSLGNPDSAIAVFKQGLQFYDSSPIYALLAFAYGSRNDMEGQRDALENQLRLSAGDAHAHYRLGLLLTVLEPEQALSHLMQAAFLDPEFDPAVQTLRAALNLSSTQPDASQQMVTIGRSLGLVREWDLAIDAFEKAVSLDAENAVAWAWLVEAKQQYGIIMKTYSGGVGRVELDKAVTLDHTSVVVRALRGLYWSRQEKYPQMLAEYLLAAEYEPTNPAWQAGLGNAYIKRGDLVAALAAYQHATELAPNESTYWSLLAVFCAENGVHLEDVGLPAAQKAVEISPDDPSALDALGLTYLSSGKYANAEQILLDATKRFPDYLPAHIHLATTYLAQGNRAAAFDTLTFVQSADPNGVNGEVAGQLLKQYFP